MMQNNDLTWHGLPNRGKMINYVVLGVYGNPNTEFKRAIELAHAWAKAKTIKSFDIAYFAPVDRNGMPLPLWEESTGCAKFVAVYYGNLSGAFHMDLWQ